MSKDDDKPSGPWGAGPSSSSGHRAGPKGPGQRPKQGASQPDMDEMVSQLKNEFRKMFGGGNGGGTNGTGRRSRGSSGAPNISLSIILGAVLALWVVSGFYKVDSKEVGVIQRFGMFTEITSPGLRYHLPYPIETVTKLGVLNINTIEVGFREGYSPRGQALQKEKLMLTGDQNIIEITFDVQWKIDETKPQDYLFNVREPEQAIRPVAESAMREVIGTVNITSVLSKQEEKLKVELQTRDIIQATLDSYGAGIRVEKVNLLTADPPAAVIDAFRDVKTAEQDKETAQNQARAYANEVVPKARGEAEKLIREAEGYKESVVSEAKGDASRFMAVYKQYVQAKDVTAKRIYLETMEKVLKNMPKVVVDGAGSRSGVVPVLPLPAMVPARAEEK